MAFSNIKGNIHFEDGISFGGTANLPDGCVDDDQVKSTNPISAEKVEHQFSLQHVQTEAGAIISAKEMVHVCRGVGEVMDIDASFGSVIPTATTETVTIKVIKFTGAASDDVMTNDVVLDDGNVVHTPEGQAGLDGAGKITAAGDVLEVQVTKAGTPVVARGLIVNIAYKETPVD